MDKHFDVIIIGSGAGGGTLARELAPSGKNVLILERGDWLKREALNWDAAAVFEHNRYVSPETWYDHTGKPFQPQVHYFVGGATKMFGAALYRLREKDFGELRHYDGISPAWPISYQDLEPYYAKAEAMYYVHGLRGADPTEPPASGPYPYPPVSKASRASRSCSTVSKRLAITRSRHRARFSSTRPTWPIAPASAVRPATAIPAWCTPSLMPRSAPCGRPSSSPT
jgi:choline dehydrogenase-like flavoprotein